MISDTDLSRALSHALRHEPWRYELELDAEGWVPVSQVLEALHSRGGDWARVDQDAIEHMIRTSEKQRHELSGSRIRARYGHSTPARIEFEPGDPPAVLFHGTAPDTWNRIHADGLRPMRRQYVHLSVDPATARAVGQRKSADPLILTVRAQDAARSGVRFYHAGDKIWLADEVPAEFVAAPEPS